MINRYRAFCSLILASMLLTACGLTPVPRDVIEPLPVAPKTLDDPVATHLFNINDDDDVIGELQVVRATKDDTFSDIARRFNLGYEELVRANPGIDPWLPGEGREIVLPTQFILPNAPREGLVVNLAELRVFYFPKHKAGEQQIVVTHPIGIGKVGWVTPEGVTKIISKKKNPVWIPPLSVRKEHAENDDPLPKIVPAGDDNPLGAFAMRLGWPGYLMHGTNKPYGVGMRASHGCMRFYPEDIALLFNEVPIGTRVQVVNQRVVSGWHNGKLYVQVMPLPEEEMQAADAEAVKKEVAARARRSAKKKAPVKSPVEIALARLAQQAKQHDVTIDQGLFDQVMKEQTNVALPVTTDKTETELLAAVRRVDNHLPPGATWDGKTTLTVTTEEFNAMRDGVILPRKEDVPAAEQKKADDKSEPGTKKAKPVSPPAT